MTTIYVTNQQKRQLIDFLRKYPYIIYVTSCLQCKFQELKFSEWSKYDTTMFQPILQK